MTFQAFGGCIECVFLTEDCLLNNFVGNQLWGFGSASAGRLGDGTTITKSSPVQTISSTTNWRNVSEGTFSIAAIKNDGTLWTWGCNQCGILGQNNLTNTCSPIQITNGGCWRRVDVGFSGGLWGHAAGIKNDGTLWTWGSNTCGGLGINIAPAAGCRSTPVNVGTERNWKDISVGFLFTLGLKTDGTLWSWGNNCYGRLGDGTTVNRSSPVQIVAPVGLCWRTISAGYHHSAAIRSDNTLWVWGTDRNHGHLGNLNSGNCQSSPVQTISQGSNWKSVTAGYCRTAAIKTDGTLWIWGSNGRGALGTGTYSFNTNASSPVQIGTSNNWKSVVIARDHNLALKTDSSIWGWGCNFNNWQQGTVCYSSPIQLQIGNLWKTVVSGKASSTGWWAIRFKE